MENWKRIYHEAPEIFAAFSRAEDPDGVLVDRLVERVRPSGRRGLEVGCGSGRYSRELARLAGRWIAVDPSRGLLALARATRTAISTPRYVAARGESLPLPDACVDVVVATWVLAYLPAALRARVLDEIDRVLRPGADGGIWLVENHWEGEFQKLRGRAPKFERAEVRPLVEECGFEVMDTVSTRLRFESSAAAERILGALLGERARAKLSADPVSSIEHRVVILHRPPAG